VRVGEAVFEELDYQRAQLRVIRHVQPIYGLPPEEQKHRKDSPVMAELPPRPLERCAASTNLLAWLLTQKFANHLPLHRQEAIFGRDGMRLPKQTLCDWTLAAAEALRPIADRLLQLVCAGVVLQLDDTPVMCQAGCGEPKLPRVFVDVRQSAGERRRLSIHRRASQLLADEIRGFRGMLIGDGYSGNSAAANKVGGDIVVGGCWAHVARKFRDAEAESPGTAKLLGDDLRALYAVEREANDAQIDREGCVALRRQKSRPILAEIFSRTRRLRGGFSDAGDMAKAMDYVRNQRKALRQFLREGLAPIDNHASERAICPVAIGRKNWLFAGSMRGGRAAAVVYSLVESCKLAASTLSHTSLTSWSGLRRTQRTRSTSYYRLGRALRADGNRVREARHPTLRARALAAPLRRTLTETPPCLRKRHIREVRREGVIRALIKQGASADSAGRRGLGGWTPADSRADLHRVGCRRCTGPCGSGAPPP
jgi:transposase